MFPEPEEGALDRMCSAWALAGPAGSLGPGSEQRRAGSRELLAGGTHTLCPQRAAGASETVLEVLREVCGPEERSRRVRANPQPVRAPGILRDRN